MVTHGIDPHIDFSNIDEVRRTVEYANQLRVLNATLTVEISCLPLSLAHIKMQSKRALIT
jgi:hypothetical protein